MWTEPWGCHPHTTAGLPRRWDPWSEVVLPGRPEAEFDLCLFFFFYLKIKMPCHCLQIGVLQAKALDFRWSGSTGPLWPLSVLFAAVFTASCRAGARSRAQAVGSDPISAAHDL